MSFHISHSVVRRNIPPYLSKGEREVFFRVVMTGATTPDLSASLRLQDRTVKFRLAEIYRKTGCGTRAELVASFWRRLCGVRAIR